MKYINALIIDDNPADAEKLNLFLNQLEEWNISVQFIITDFESLDLYLRDNKVDIVFVDQKLGHIDGLELIEKFSSQYFSIAFILVTGFESDVVGIRLLRSGAIDYMSKSELSLNMLKQVIDNAISKKIMSHRLEALCKDPVTSLYNRTMFNTCLESVINEALRYQRKFALILLDLDDFKQINERLGHQVGDVLLGMVAQRLKKIIRNTDLLARLGGDEFVIILNEIKKSEHIGKICENILTALSNPFMLKEEQKYIGASMGVSVFPDDSTNPENLIRYADMAMYRAKENGKNNYQYYQKEMTRKANERGFLVDGIRKALKQDEFQIYLQPQYDLKESSLCGLEVLLRWQHPELGMIMPDKFIPIAEESGLINSLTDFLINKTLPYINEFSKKLDMPFEFSINISPNQLLNSHFLESINEYKNSGYDLTHLAVEITEGTFIQNTEEVKYRLKRLKNFGIKISLDDFGTGYSCLSYIKELPIDSLKIDKSFIIDKRGLIKDQELVKAIISIGHHLNLEVVAEGVEHENQLISLKENECDIGQGFYFSKPKPAELILNDIETYVRI